ncbi:uncharacterized protein LOC128584671 isoform X3 [Nycticebus coucang]|uniref:uncharacterized protein LOC128584671 isoform X3 n=1 Tax=Nycticebus coucang TaxID=9470 RepID=UPI00234DB8A9|nr:uncharacterized protein LOC128584671 isoform X3 [Nycticebus coucang]
MAAQSCLSLPAKPNSNYHPPSPPRGPSVARAFPLWPKHHARRLEPQANPSAELRAWPAALSMIRERIFFFQLWLSVLCMHVSETPEPADPEWSLNRCPDTWDPAWVSPQQQHNSPPMSVSAAGGRAGVAHTRFLVVRLLTPRSPSPAPSRAALPPTPACQEPSCPATGAPTWRTKRAPGWGAGRILPAESLTLNGHRGSLGTRTHLKGLSPSGL